MKDANSNFDNNRRRKLSIIGSSPITLKCLKYRLMGKAIINYFASCLYRSVEERFLTWLIPRRRQFESDRCKEYGAKPPRGVFWIKLICTIIKILYIAA